MRGSVILGFALAVLMVIAGAVLTARGLGYTGEPGSGRSLALVGPLLAGLGVALMISIVGVLRR